jgi:hypothetical protein
MKAVSAVIAALLCTVVPAKSAGPSPYFKDVKIMSYDLWNPAEGRCALDWKAWNTAMTFVANQSVKLKLVTERDYWEHTKQLSDEASKALSHLLDENGLFDQKIPEKDRQALDRAHVEAVERLRKSWVPRLSFFISTIELDRGCAGMIRANVQVSLEDGRLRGQKEPCTIHPLKSGAAPI